MPLGTEVGLGPGYIVLDGDPDPLKGAQPPVFGPGLLWPNGRPSLLLLSTCIVRLHLTIVTDRVAWSVCRSVTLGSMY